MKAVRELGLPVSANARLILGTDEESGSADIAYYYAREPYAPTPLPQMPISLSSTSRRDITIPISARGGSAPARFPGWPP